MKRKVITIISIFAIFIMGMLYVCYTTEQESAISLPKQYCAYTGVNETYIARQEIAELPPFKVLIGKFKLTAYCACEQCCGKTDGITATGTQATQGRTIAVNPSVIPYNTHVWFNNHEYVCEDCGGAIKQNRIDVFFNNHSDAKQFGVQNDVNVYMEVNNSENIASIY